jgi:hypothetical protein
MSKEIASRGNRLDRLKQLVIDMIWLGFLVIIIWMILRVVGL